MSDDYQDWQSGVLKVVQNQEGQYSIWPVDKETPAGWSEVGKTGTKDECLSYIREVWKLTPSGGHSLDPE